MTLRPVLCGRPEDVDRCARELQLLVQPAHGEGAHDVADALHQRPDPGEDEQDVGLRMKNWPAVQNARPS